MNAQQLLAKIKAYPLALSLLGAAILMAGWAYWRQDAYAAALDQRKEVADTFAVVFNNVNAGRDLDVQQAQLTEGLKKFNDALLDSTTIIANQQYFYGFEQSTGVQIIDPTQGHTERGKDPAEPSVTTFTLAASGHWDNITSLFYGLQTGPRLLRISQFHLEKSRQQRTDGADVNRMDLALTVEVLGK